MFTRYRGSKPQVLFLFEQDWIKLTDNIGMFIAWRLPLWLVEWCFIRVSNMMGPKKYNRETKAVEMFSWIVRERRGLNRE